MPVYKARLNRDPGGAWVASSVELPNCWSRGGTREEALAKLRDEIRYRIEYCPCSGVDEEFVRVELQVAPESRGEAPPTDPGRAGRTTQPASESRPAWPAARPAAQATLSGVAGCPAPAREPGRPETARPAPWPERPPAPRASGWRRWDD